MRNPLGRRHITNAFIPNMRQISYVFDSHLMTSIIGERSIPDLYDLYDTYNLAHVLGWEPQNLHGLHTVGHISGLDMHYPGTRYIYKDILHHAS